MPFSKNRITYSDVGSTCHVCVVCVWFLTHIIVACAAAALELEKLKSSPPSTIEGHCIFLEENQNFDIHLPNLYSRVKEIH